MLKKTTLAVLLSYADEVANKTSISQEKQSSNLAEVYDLLEVMQAKENYKKVLNATLGRQAKMLPPSIANDPQKVKKYQKIMSDFTQKYMGWEAIKEDMAKIYAKYYTKKELEELKKFYATEKSS